jgi:hypothetical protein
MSGKLPNPVETFYKRDISTTVGMFLLMLRRTRYYEFLINSSLLTPHS